jgi:primosomal protein N' (replication factor Y)
MLVQHGLQLLATALAQGRQALVLLPEIALGAQWLDRFRQRFGVSPAIWHSEIPMGQRRATWRAVATGEARIVVGARSALFLPYKDLGLIVVDDDDAHAQAVADSLRRINCDCTIATSGRFGLASAFVIASISAASNGPAQAIFANCAMP